MLLRFGVSNHLSIRDYQELLLSASKRIKRDGMTMPVPTVNEAVVPLAAVYGPNASGKSNLIEALAAMREAVVRSHKDLSATDPIPRYPFRLDATSRASPTQFDCSFTLGKTSHDETGVDEAEKVYEYGFEYTKQAFQREWLYQTVRKQRQSTQLLFERETRRGQVEVNFGGELRGQNRLIEKITRPNSLFLSAAAQNNHPQLTEIFRYFAEHWRVILYDAPLTEAEVTLQLVNYQHLERLLLLVRQADVGITDIDVQDTPPNQLQLNLARSLTDFMVEHVTPHIDAEELDNMVSEQLQRQKRLRLVHSGGEGTTQAFDYTLESKGTRTLISLLIPALKSLATGSLLVVDELDTSLHPDLARAFVSLFNRPSSNPHGAQLIFSTHDVSLLGGGVIQQDEIWLADKGHDGVSRFTPLTEFRLRSRDDIEKAYRAGRVGGVPSSDDFFLEFSRGPSHTTQ